MMAFGMGAIGGTPNSDPVSRTREGVRGAHQAVRDVMDQLHEFLDAQDLAIKRETETRLMERLQELSGMLNNAGSGSLQGISPSDVTDLEDIVSQLSAGGPGNSQVIHQAQQLIDDIKSQLGMVG